MEKLAGELRHGVFSWNDWPRIVVLRNNYGQGC